MKTILLVALLAASASPAAAADICNAIALTDVPMWNDGDPSDSDPSFLKKGEIDDAVTQYVVNRKTGDSAFCSHGGYCYPRYLTKAGRRVEALRLTNCMIGSAYPLAPGMDGDEVRYQVIVDRSKNSKEALRFDDIDTALLHIGMCSVCAANAADIYLKHPDTHCGSVVAGALAGDNAAITELRSEPSYCREENPSGPLRGVESGVPEQSASLPPGVSDDRSYLKAVLAIAGALYFVPSAIAFGRRKRKARTILTLNVFLGWTLLGWIVALALSLVRDAVDRAPPNS